MKIYRLILVILLTAVFYGCITLQGYSRSMLNHPTDSLAYFRHAFLADLKPDTIGIFQLSPIKKQSYKYSLPDLNQDSKGIFPAQSSYSLFSELYFSRNIIDTFQIGTVKSQFYVSSLSDKKPVRTARVEAISFNLQKGQEIMAECRVGYLHISPLISMGLPVIHASLSMLFEEFLKIELLCNRPEYNFNIDITGLLNNDTCSFSYQGKKGIIFTSYDMRYNDQIMRRFEYIDNPTGYEIQLDGRFAAFINVVQSGYRSNRTLYLEETQSSVQKDFLTMLAAGLIEYQLRAGIGEFFYWHDKEKS